jgi:hypothetical protein
MLDKPDKALNLVAALQAAAPFEVEFSPSLIAHLRAERVDCNTKSRQSVSRVSYAGDEGGILCHIERDDTARVLIVSITHLQLRRSLPFAPAVFEYQRHRLKKLKKLNGVQ